MTKTLNQLAAEGIKFVVIKKDDTSMWIECIREKAKTIETVCLIDLTHPTNLCELAISYPYSELKNFFTFKEDISQKDITAQLDDSEYAELSEGYFNGSSKFHIERIYNDERDFEAVYENEQCNPTIC